MRVFRIIFIRHALLLMMGVTFLNTSFFLLEISLLNPNKSALGKLVSNSIMEEKKDVEEESSGGSSSLKESEFDLIPSKSLNHHSGLAQHATHKAMVNYTLRIHEGYLEIFSPPPEQIT